MTSAKFDATFGTKNGILIFDTMVHLEDFVIFYANFCLDMAFATRVSMAHLLRFNQVNHKQMKFSRPYKLIIDFE